MPSDKPDKVLKWRHAIAAVQTLDPDDFAQRVLEYGLRIIPTESHLYAAMETDDGYDMIRCVAKWEYQSFTQGTIAQPAAQANPATTTFTASGYLTYLDYVYFTLTTDANVATRLVVLGINDGTNTVWTSPSLSIVANTVGSFAFAKGTNYFSTTPRFGAPLPEIPWTHTSQLLWATTSAQAGDQYSAVRYGIRRIPI